MSSLTVAPEAGGTTVFGKTVSTLQTDVNVGNDAITGTLLYVSDYTEFNATPEKQAGNFLALNITNGTAGSTLKTELIGGTEGDVKLDGDTKAVFRITNKDKQKIKFTITKDGDTASKIYSVSGLVLTPRA